jgi:hypothetical protein
MLQGSNTASFLVILDRATPCSLGDEWILHKNRMSTWDAEGCLLRCSTSCEKGLFNARTCHRMHDASAAVCATSIDVVM